MKNKIEQIIVNHIDRKISLGEATTQILRLFAVSGQSEQLKAFLDEIANDKTYILNDYYKNKAKQLSKSL